MKRESLPFINWLIALKFLFPRQKTIDKYFYISISLVCHKVCMCASCNVYVRFPGCRSVSGFSWKRKLQSNNSNQSYFTKPTACWTLSLSHFARTGDQFKVFHAQFVQLDRVQSYNGLSAVRYKSTLEAFKARIVISSKKQTVDSSCFIQNSTLIPTILKKRWARYIGRLENSAEQDGLVSVHICVI